MGCIWPSISLMCLLKAACRWTQNEKEAVKDIKREFIQSILHKKSTLWWISGKEEKRGRMWWVTNRHKQKQSNTEDKQERNRTGLHFNILSLNPFDHGKKRKNFKIVH